MKITTTYLEMLARPERVVPPPREGLAVVHAREPSVAYYRFLYDAVGRDYDWTSESEWGTHGPARRRIPAAATCGPVAAGGGPWLR